MAASSSEIEDDFTMPDRKGSAAPRHGDTTTSNSRSSASLVMTARSSSVSGWFDTINVATASANRRLVSDVAPGENQRDTLNSPPGLRRSRNKRQPSMVYSPFSDSVNA